MIGEMIGNHKILSQIGQGGMGTVYQAEDMRLGRKVAIKILNPSLLARGGKELERFQSEAKVQANLNNPNVVTLYGFEPYQDSWAMIMEYVEGKTLSELVRNVGALPSHIVVMICKQVLDGLSAAHRQGVVHRDLKPSNIMLTPDGLAKVMDFGIAKVEGGKSLTASGALVGTVFYMSPEQVRGEPVDARSDIYSFGIILFELLTGRVPFKDESDFSIMIHHVQTPAPPPTQLLPDVPSDLEDIVMACLAKNPAERFQSAAAVDAAFEFFAEQQRAMGQSELYSRRTLIAWLAEAGQPRAAAPAPDRVAIVLPPPPTPPPYVPPPALLAPRVSSSMIQPPPQVADLFATNPAAAAPHQPIPQPVQEKKGGGKALLFGMAFLIVVAAGAGAYWYLNRGGAGTPPAITQTDTATTQAQAGLPTEPTAPPAATQPAATTTPPEQAAVTTPPVTPPAATNVEKSMPPAESKTQKAWSSSKPASGAQLSAGAGTAAVLKPKPAAVAPPVRETQPPAGQTEPAVARPAGGFLIFLDPDQASERVPLTMAQSRIAEILREAGHQVVSSSLGSANVRAALDRNELAEVRRAGVGYVVLGTAHASVDQQNAYGSTYYVGQVSVTLELVRTSDGKVAATGSSDAKGKGSSNAQSSLSEALMTAASDAARELLRNFK